MTKDILGLIVGFILLFVIFKIQESKSYQKYIEIDGCIYLETYHTEGYSSSKTKTMVGCDSDTKEKYKTKLNIEF